MGTVVTIDLFDHAQWPLGELELALKEAINILHSTDDVFSTWKPDSTISMLRRGEVSESDCPDEVREVLAICRKAYTISRGWFDPWSMAGGVDPTGCVKGWSAQRALHALRRTGVQGALVNAAGDVASFGGLGAGKPFRIGIVNPTARRELACVVDSPGAVATSATYERGAHLIDPHTGRARSLAASATITGPDLGLADALATALAVAGEEMLRTIENLEGYEGFIVGFDRLFKMTSHFPVAATST
jgi:thiamine biosynthesis lipoprotein